KKDIHSRLSLRSWAGVRAQRFVWRSGMVILAKPPSARLWKPSALVRLMSRRCETARSSSRKVGQAEARTLPSINRSALKNHAMNYCLVIRFIIQSGHNIGHTQKRSAVAPIVSGTKEKAPQVGLEPTTLRLTAGCSAIELLRSNGTDGAVFTGVTERIYQSGEGGSMAAGRPGRPRGYATPKL